MPAFVEAIVDVDEGMALAMISAINSATSAASMTAWNQAGYQPYYRRKVREAFQSEGTKEYGKWASLAAATENIRAAAGFPPQHPILERTGALRNWLTGNMGYGGFVAGPSAWINSQGTMVGTNDYVLRFWYPDNAPTPLLENKLRVAQKGNRQSRRTSSTGSFGSRSGGRRLSARGNKGHSITPARPILTASPDDLVPILASMSTWIAGRTAYAIGRVPVFT